MWRDPPDDVDIEIQTEKHRLSYERKDIMVVLRAKRHQLISGSAHDVEQTKRDVADLERRVKDIDAAWEHVQRSARAMDRVRRRRVAKRKFRHLWNLFSTCVCPCRLMPGLPSLQEDPVCKNTATYDRRPRPTKLDLI